MLSAAVGIPFGAAAADARTGGVGQGDFGRGADCLWHVQFGLAAAAALDNRAIGLPFRLYRRRAGGAYNTNGPPVVIYATLRRWPPSRFRATMQAYFLPSSLLIAAGHGLAGLWTRDVLALSRLRRARRAASASPRGALVHRHIPIAAFRRVIYGVLIVGGVLMFV